MQIEQIQIMPVKRLYAALEREAAENTVAVVCSSYDIDERKLPIPHVSENFDDLDQEVPGRSLSAAAAGRIADFIKGIGDTVTKIYVCCDSGESRSSAIAAAICRFYGLSDLHIWTNPKYHPNPYVFLHICDSLNIPITDAQLDYLIEENHRAFHNAIHGN